MAVPRWCWFIACCAASACSSHRYFAAPLQQAERDFNDHIGFVIYDPATGKTIHDHHGDRYFTPASNTKIFTLYASLMMLGDSIPALRYVERGDSLIFWGTGDPGFLYENLKGDSTAYNFLRNHPSKLFFSSANFATEYFGPGWSWDDYNESYQVEKTPFPIYGNRASIKKVDTTFVPTPAVFSFSTSDSSTMKGRSMMLRDIASNQVLYRPGKTSRPAQWKIPFHYSDELLAKLLADTIKKEVKLLHWTLPHDSKTLYSFAPDSLYKVMMQASDNFIAEQLLLLCANVVSDTLKPEIAIDYAKKKFLFDLPDKPIWVDGSGLSRYNLFTPRSIVRLWEKIYGQVPRERLFSLLAVGGESGTIKDYYKAEKPFIFGKTGFLSNNYTLSGYLVTKRGRTLIFSWMNNNFTTSSGAIRGRMETVLKKIYEKY